MALERVSIELTNQCAKACWFAVARFGKPPKPIVPVMAAIRARASRPSLPNWSTATLAARCGLSAGGCG
jgi:hypothetical protein